MNDLRVSSLITSDQRRWDIRKIEELFSPTVVVKILKITFSPNPHIDKWLWTEEKNGIFSVRSAYRLITCNKRLNLGESSMIQQQTFFMEKVVKNEAS